MQIEIFGLEDMSSLKGLESIPDYKEVVVMTPEKAQKLLDDLRAVRKSGAQLIGMAIL